MTGHELTGGPNMDGWTGQCECGWLASGIASLDLILLMHSRHLREVQAS